MLQEPRFTAHMARCSFERCTLCTLLGCAPCQIQKPQIFTSAKLSGMLEHFGAPCCHGHIGLPGKIRDTCPASSHGTSIAARHNARKPHVMANTSTGCMGAQEAVLSLLSSCLPYSSLQSQNVYFKSETLSLHWKSELRNAWGQ